MHTTQGRVRRMATKRAGVDIRQLTIELSPEDERAVRAAARAESRSVPEFIRIALRDRAQHTLDVLAAVTGEES